MKLLQGQLETAINEFSNLRLAAEKKDSKRGDGQAQICRELNLDKAKTQKVYVTIDELLRLSNKYLSLRIGDGIAISAPKIYSQLNCNSKASRERAVSLLEQIDLSDLDTNKDNSLKLQIPLSNSELLVCKLNPRGFKKAELDKIDDCLSGLRSTEDILKRLVDLKKHGIRLVDIKKLNNGSKDLWRLKRSYSDNRHGLKVTLPVSEMCENGATIFQGREVKIPTDPRHKDDLDGIEYMPNLTGKEIVIGGLRRRNPRYIVAPNGRVKVYYPVTNSSGVEAVKHLHTQIKNKDT